MLGLCFLIIDNIECEEIWSDWLSGNEDKVSITIHSKKPYTLRTDLFKQKATFIPTIPTRWGHFSLVQATINLFNESIKNSVSHCILVSGACIPMKPFHIVYQTLQSNIGKSFVSSLPAVTDNRYHCSNLRLKQLFPNKNIICKKHHQWIIPCRNHINFILKHSELITKIYHNTRFSDESWFLTFLTIQELENEIVQKETTFTNWKYDSNICHPKTYLEISDEELNEIINNPEYLFGRKFTQNTKNLGLLWTNTIQSYNA